MSKKIIMTGGGSAGHVTPNLALIPRLTEEGYEIQYIGTKDGIEKKIIEEAKIKYHAIDSGKFRRYFDMKNFSDPFKVVKGIFQAKNIIKKENPNIVFSKGGFVSVPVVIGAYLSKVPVITHESDITPGLANKLSTPYCTKVCVTFPESVEKIKNKKGILTGTPLRRELFNGNKEKGLITCRFKNNNPIIMLMGGSLGSKILNESLREILGEVLKSYNVIHICGKGHLDHNLNNKLGYVQFEYVNKELPNLMKAADMFISRAGANSIFEFLALKKPNILIPLSAKASRGDQILNAKSFENSGYSVVIEEENLNAQLLLSKIDYLYRNREKYINNMENSKVQNGVEQIITLIKKYSK